MKRIFTIFIIVFASWSLTIAQEVKINPLEQELVKVHGQITEAFNQANKSAVDDLFADDYIVTNEKGERFGKADAMKLLLSLQALGNVRVAEKLSDVQVRDYGDIALLNFANNVVIHVNDQIVDKYFRSTEIYRRRNGRWQLAASQSTTVFDFASLQQ